MCILKSTWLVFGFVVLIGGGVAEAAIIVDDFDVRTIAYPGPPGFTRDTTVGTSVFTETAIPVANTIGGIRESTIAATNIDSPGDDQIAYRISSSGVADFSSTAGAAGFLSLLYQGNGDLNANFSSSTGLIVHFTSFDLASSAPLPVTLTLFDGSVTSAVSQSLTTAGEQDLVFNFSSFSGLNTGSINSIQFTFQGATAHDFSLDYITESEVPEPASVLMCLSGLLAFAAVSLRRRRA